MQKLLYIRHGKTVGNDEGNYIGQSESPLLEEGRRQAVLAGQALIDSGEKVQIIYTSSLSRAYDTAIIIAQKIGYNPNDIIKTDLLLERAGGQFEGRPQSEFFALSEQDQIKGGAESLKALGIRAGRLYEKLKVSHKNDVVLLVGSAGIGEMLRAIVKYDDYQRMFDDGPLPNAEVVRLL